MTFRILPSSWKYRVYPYINALITSSANTAAGYFVTLLVENGTLYLTSLFERGGKLSNGVIIGERGRSADAEFLAGKIHRSVDLCSAPHAWPAYPSHSEHRLASSSPRLLPSLLPCPKHMLLPCPPRPPNRVSSRTRS